MTPTDLDRLRCPTCRAEQEPSPTCRRCKCDLSLLLEAAAEYRRVRSCCLRELRHGRAAAALARARDCLRLRADAPSRRLFAVCALLAGDWTSAAAAARQAADEADAPEDVGKVSRR